MELTGIGPSGADRLLSDIGDIGDIARFASRAHFASWNGTAPIDASSGTGSLAPGTGAATTDAGWLRARLRWRPYGHLKRRLSDIVYRQMVADAKLIGTGPGGHVGATLQSSAADPNPEIGTSGKVTSRTRHTPA
jgi:hypothetical protein